MDKPSALPRKLLILPGYCDSLGGTMVTLEAILTGFRAVRAEGRLCVLVRAGSFMEQYLRDRGHTCIVALPSADQPRFWLDALGWAMAQPSDHPLLLEHWVDRRMLPLLASVALRLRLSGRLVLHSCHDLALSFQPLGFWARRLTFALLAPRVICNSLYTAKHVRVLMPRIEGILHPPIDTERFSCRPVPVVPPELLPILRPGVRLMLTPSRISSASRMNDKNLRALPRVLASLKAADRHYHGVVVGDDLSPGRVQTQLLIEQAAHEGVGDRFTVLPRTTAIERYFQCADVVVTLAPREPFGRTVAEAVACGVPVVGSNSGGIQEILHHFAPEWTADPGDPVQVARTILTVASDPATPERLARGRRWVEQNCSAVHYARRLLALTNLATGEDRPVPAVTRR
ncbi:MAG: glycosyltransferase family 4 protein [Aphanocapsa lilacina HA4352-LM1]|nr:glycosyltransferase family 4 protein [Aphanocapsa lilacina HA4352-LM1]